MATKKKAAHHLNGVGPKEQRMYEDIKQSPAGDADRSRSEPPACRGTGRALLSGGSFPDGHGVAARPKEG